MEAFVSCLFLFLSGFTGLVSASGSDVVCSGNPVKLDASGQQIALTVSQSEFQHITNDWKTKSQPLSGVPDLQSAQRCLTKCCEYSWCEAVYFQYEMPQAGEADSSGTHSCTSIQCADNCSQLILPQMESLRLAWPQALKSTGDRLDRPFLVMVTRQYESSSGTSGATEAISGSMTSEAQSAASSSSTSPSNFVSTLTSPSSTKSGSTPSSASVELKLEVTSNVTVQLPNDSISLSVVVHNIAEFNPTSFMYDWTLIDLPHDADRNGLMTGQSSSEVTLRKLIAGSYLLRVRVNATVANGDRTVTNESLISVLVQPAVSPNSSPIARIKPSTQTIRLPAVQVAFDGLESSDTDGKIDTYKWRVLSHPPAAESEVQTIDDQPLFVLHLSSSKSHAIGNYTIELLVTDDRGATSSAHADLTVLPAADAPPRAIVDATQKQLVLTLPKNSVALRGNESTDDNGIVKYEWRKLGGPDLGDIQGTNQPVLQLSNLVEGTYTFRLTVTDSAEQSDSTEVTIFVRAHSSRPPVARIRVPDSGIIEMRLPTSECQLDASDSTDDARIVSFSWSQSSGPVQVQLLNPESSVVTAQRMSVPGDYVYTVQVRDEDNITANATVLVRVLPSNRRPPMAHCANSRTRVDWPQRCAVLDARASHDPLGAPLSQFEWSRLPDSLAAGYSLRTDSDTILLCELVPGTYRFGVKVTDVDGLSHSTTCVLDIVSADSELAANVTSVPLPSNYSVSIALQRSDLTFKAAVKPRDLVELRLRTQLTSFREIDKLTLTNQLSTFLLRKLSDFGFTSADSESHRVVVHVVRLSEARAGGDLLVLFYVELVPVIEKDSQTSTVKDTQVLDGRRVVDVLDAKLSEGGNDVLLEFEALAIDTSVCTADCNGHGVCDEQTRQCLCDQYWLPDMFSAKSLSPRTNCAWSVLYVVLFCIIFIAAGSTVAVFLCRCCRKGRTKRALAIRLRRRRAAERHQIRISRPASPSGPRISLGNQGSYQPLRNEAPSDATCSDEELFSQRRPPSVERSLALHSIADSNSNSPVIAASQPADQPKQSTTRRRRGSTSSEISSSSTERAHRFLAAGRGVASNIGRAGSVGREDLIFIPDVTVRDSLTRSPAKRPNPLLDGSLVGRDDRSTAEANDEINGNDTNVKLFDDSQPYDAASFHAAGFTDEMSAEV